MAGGELRDEQSVPVSRLIDVGHYFLLQSFHAPSSRPTRSPWSPKPLAEVALEVVLPDGEERREEDVPDAGHDEQRHDLEVLRVERSGRWSSAR